MQGLERQMLRLGFVIALGSGLAFAAAHAAGTKTAARQNPAPIVLAMALESDSLPARSFAPDEQSAQEEARVDQCAFNPHDIADNHLIGDKSAHRGKKSRIAVCG